MPTVIVSATLHVVKNNLLLPVVSLFATVLLAGCGTRPTATRGTNPDHPGAAVGYAVGNTVGAVTGSVVGAVAGGAEGVADAMKAPFNNERRYVRKWRTETTADGRTIQVPYDVEVDAQGHVIAPKSN